MLGRGIYHVRNVQNGLIVLFNVNCYRTRTGQVVLYYSQLICGFKMASLKFQTRLESS